MRLTQALEKERQQNPDRTAAACGARRSTFAELGAGVERVAGALRALGTGPGNRVGMPGPYTDRFLKASCYGTWWLGAVLVPVNCRWSADEIARSLDDAGAQQRLVDDPLAAMLLALRERSRTLRTVVYLGDGPLPEGALDWKALLTVAQPVPDVGVGGNAAAVLFYTGGTTGRAKGVLLSHASLYVTTLASIAIGQRAPGAVCLHSLPMFLVGGLAVVLQAMAGQSTHVMLPAFDPAVFLSLIAQERVTEAALVPAMIKRVVDCPASREVDLASLERLYYGASPITATLLEQTLLALPGVFQCAVLGVPDADSGERVHAVMVLQLGATVDAEAVIARCKLLIAGYKCRRSAEFRSELPISGAGKLLKYKLREAYWVGQPRHVG